MIRSLLVLLSALTAGSACVAAASAATSAPAVAEAAASGPTPYPAQAKDWPGQGAIRVFGWMTENRKAFWQQRERQQGSVVFAGDSLVGGWVSLAKDLPDLPVANRGIGGEVTRGLLFRFQEDVLDLHPRAIVLLSGTNDLSAQQPPAQTQANLKALLDLAERQAPGVPIVLCTLPPRNQPQAPVDPARLAEVNRLIVATAKGRPRVAVLDLHALLADADGMPRAEYFGRDGLHISPAGYQRFRDALRPLLKQLDVG